MLTEFFRCSFNTKDMSAALNERNKENRQDTLETNLNNDGETRARK